MLHTRAHQGAALSQRCPDAGRYFSAVGPPRCRPRGIRCPDRRDDAVRSAAPKSRRPVLQSGSYEGSGCGFGCRPDEVLSARRRRLRLLIQLREMVGLPRRLAPRSIRAVSAHRTLDCFSRKPRYAAAHQRAARRRRSRGSLSTALFVLGVFLERRHDAGGGTSLGFLARSTS